MESSCGREPMTGGDLFSSRNEPSVPLHGSHKQTLRTLKPLAEQMWPEACKGKSYCHIQPDYYPKETFAKLLDGVVFKFEQGGGLGNRSSELDVASCPPIKIFEKFYLILDENDKIRFVAQHNDVFTFKMEIEECSTPGRTYDSSALDEDQLQEQRVDCYETRQPFKFPVLSLDGTKLESVAPKGGVPLSCSAKVIAS